VRTLVLRSASRRQLSDLRSRCTIDSLCKCRIPAATCCAIFTRISHSNGFSTSFSAVRSDPPAMNSVTCVMECKSQSRKAERQARQRRTAP
jgi:hypothetical protein